MAWRHTTGHHLLKRAGFPLLVGWIGLFFCVSSVAAASEGAVLQRIRSGRHSTHTRIVLELEGSRPSSIGPLSDQGFPVSFQSLKSRLRPQALKTRWPAPVLNITIEEKDGASVVWIGFRDVAVLTEQRVLPRSKTTYHLVLDFSPESGTGNSPVKPGQLPAPQGMETPHAADPGTPDGTGNPFVEGDALFMEHQEDLAPVAGQILEQYHAAFRTDPRAQQAPLALYRSALCHLALGDGKKAEEAFKQVLTNFSQHAIAPLAWSGLGQALLKRQAYMESIQALRTAINGLLEPSQIAEAYYCLGKSFHRMAAYKDALEALTKSLEHDPSGYVRRPDLLRLLGEAYFVNQQYDKCATYLLWYLNIEKDVSEKDLLLAKIGESLMYTGDQDLAKKVYIYIDKYFPETEGYVISKIRRAEYFERQNPPNKTAASAIYEELSQRSLSGPLGEFLTFKVASWERERKNFPRALEWIEDGLQNSTTPKAREELIDLKVKVLLDYIQETHTQQDYAKTLQLFQENEALLGPLMTADNSQMIAESCTVLKLYPAAAEVYQKLYAKTGSKNEEWLFKAARNYFQMGDMERTQVACQAVQGEVFQTEKTMLLGKAFYEQGKYKEAAQELAKHIQKKGKIEETEPDVLFSYAESLMLSDRTAEALSFLDKLTRVPALAEGEPRIRIGLMQSRCYHKQKQNSEATEVLEHLLTLSPPEAMRDRLNYELSRVYLEMGQPQKATEKLTQLAQSSSGLFKTAAQQELGYLQLHGGSPGKGSN